MREKDSDNTQYSRRLNLGPLKELFDSINRDREEQGLNTGNKDVDDQAAMQQFFEVLEEKYSEK